MCIVLSSLKTNVNCVTAVNPGGKGSGKGGTGVCAGPGGGVAAAARWWWRWLWWNPEWHYSPGVPYKYSICRDSQSYLVPLDVTPLVSWV